MNPIDYRTKNKGVGLIEVLVSLVVIGLGLMAVASMQGNFLSGSGNSKTRAEAQTLAEQKIEEFRNNMILGDYTAIATSLAPENIAGSNETFTRSWTVNDLISPNRKQLIVTVSWGGGGADQQVALTSEIAFSDPASSVSLANSPDDGSGSYGQAPSPGQNASKTVDDETIEIFDANNNLNSNLTATTINGNTFYVNADGDMYRQIGGGRNGEQVFLCSTLSQFEADLSSPQNYDASTGNLLATPTVYLYTRRLNLDVVAGNEVIELFTQNFTASRSGNTVTYSTDGSCTREHRFFGGIIIPIKGTVHTLFNLDDIKIDHNKEDMFCVFNSGAGQTSRPYACYVGGNCDVSAAGDEADVTQCPNPVAADAKVGPGGFSGNTGLINVNDSGGGKESVCFEEELEGTNTNFSTARKYKTLNAGKEQGINEAHSCQDFLIVSRQANERKLSAECSAKAASMNLAPKEIVRTINGPNVVVTTVNQNYCGARTLNSYTLTITVKDGTPTSVKTLSGTNCVLGGTGATCTETTYGKTARVYAKNATQSGTCTITPLSLAQANSCTIELHTTPLYTLTGSLTGTGPNPSQIIIEDSFGNTGTCTISSPTFSCSIATSDTTVTIQAQKVAGSKVTVVDYCAQVVAPNGSANGTNTYSDVCPLVKK